ncbi:DUF1048 domain-containing protein [Herbidospora yilanensis]|uniref:DUF1048 domain-containing protein n=1 Tax=Herbidospora yilanensis TaxID=354426 RepID=UPI00078646EB|nr:DUF1048 domain-containing protein [Herbidospora yilanensis]
MTPQAPEDKSRYRRCLELVTGSLDDKRRYRQVKARMERLPGGYRIAYDALERYLTFFGRADGPGWLEMYEDLADLFEQSAANTTPIRDVFGDDPVEFVETFVQNYPVGRWMARERDRFTGAVARAAGEQDRRAS